MMTGPNRECSTLVLVTLAAATLILARFETSLSPLWMFASSLVSVSVPWLVCWSLRFGQRAARGIESRLALFCVIWSLTPVVSEFVLRKFGVGEAPELVMLSCLQNAALMTAAFSHRKRCQQISCLLCAFLVLFAFVIGNSPAVYVMTGLFGVSMLWWLMARYWERVQRTVIVGETERCLPMRSSVLGVAILLVLALALLGTTDASTYVLKGFMPTSGGDQVNDDYARAGVGDGDQTVAAQEDAMSFGPVESELFIESEVPSLYDVFNDMYGEPVKSKKKRQRAIALSSETFKQNHQKLAKTQRSGREFSALRRNVKRRGQNLDDRNAAALLYVVGRVPLHLAMERFDTFDGITWTHSGSDYPHPPIRLEKEREKPWAYFSRLRTSTIHREVEPHAIKFINLETNRFPSPPQLAALHVDRVDQPDFFGWTDDGVAHMPTHERIPQLTVARCRSQTVNLESLRDSGSWVPVIPQESELSQENETATGVLKGMLIRHSTVSGDSVRLSHLAKSWTQDVPRGWRQIESVVQNLREGFQLDRHATPPEECRDVVSHFLSTGSGPDYLFASTAAMLLRELGYPTRLVSGFYATDERYDQHGGQTTVLPADVHVWVEVYVGNDTWVAIEPTPGYASPYEALTWRQRLAQVWRSLWGWCCRAWPWLVATSLFLTAAWLTRRLWLSRLLEVICLVAGSRSPRRRVLWTLRLLEWRAWLGGRPRPKTAAFSTWYASVAASLSSETSRELATSLRFAELCLYAPLERQAFELQNAKVARVCKAVRRHVGVKCFRQAASGQGKS